ncbi:MAG: hypothetical protein IKM29_05330 [Clostridia bacterium]|nr:hypothetical protein [Clostridia bacterium]
MKAPLAASRSDSMKISVQRKSPRLPSFDYNAGAYFITICTQDKRCILSSIVGTGVLDCPAIKLSEYGKIAEKYICQLDEFYDHLSVESYVIMPNHIHILLLIKDEGQSETHNGQSRTPNGQSRTPNGQSRTPVPTCNLIRANSEYSKFVSTFKRFCNREYGENIWQARSYDHIIRDRSDFDKHRKYIYENPFKWTSDELFTKA